MARRGKRPAPESEANVPTPNRLRIWGKGAVKGAVPQQEQKAEEGEQNAPTVPDQLVQVEKERAEARS